MLTFENLIEHNKRVSIFLVLGMMALIAVLGASFALAISGGDTRHAFEVGSLGAIGGAVCAAVGAIFSYYAGGWMVMGMMGAKEVQHCDDPVLVNVVEEMAIAAGIPVPKIYAIFDDAPNAFATGRDPAHSMVAITTGLRSKLTRDELQAVMAHELAHIKNYDIRLMMLVGVFAGIIVMMADFFWRGFGRGSGRSRSSSEGPKNIGVYLAVIGVALILSLIAPLIAKLMRLAVSREREYLADATAVQFCRNPAALSSALKKISTDKSVMAVQNRALEHMFIINPNPSMRLRFSGKDSIWSTHPPVIRRISRLNALAGEAMAAPEG